ncbi:hypothetical protein KFL_003430020 [Klebsormidium nitens]|uniref:Uncharacterized protein n=1 Tax=Klebsormidium nitens TaxID=105231 RepID=A0A0U9HKF0_KLENI|nr:hypothetical protein KFL_003430020 [Klebsormidium nitens]|eukprot:GAQ87283.1 hypothetical protein KFL_003430020 [Klebsormidium nitens]
MKDRLEQQSKQHLKEVTALRVKHRSAIQTFKGTLEGTALRERKMQGGSTAPTLRKMSSKIETMLTELFANSEARRQALYEHYRRHPSDYQLITNVAAANRTTFEALCRLHPEWLQPHQRAVIEAIEAAWTVNQCLAMQIHCKLGHGEKWQNLINLLCKTYNSLAKEWQPREILYEGSKLYLPSLKSKGRVNEHRETLHAIIPLLQNEDGTACWTELPLLINETILLDRARGYLQSRTLQNQDKVWLHWGGDAAGWLRGQSHSIWGFKLLGNQRVVSHSPKDMRVALTFEGKDKYSTYKEYLQPFLQHMEDLAEGGVLVENTQYEVEQTMGADYVLMCELLGHSGAGATNGCCLCEQHKDLYGKTVLNDDGRRVPVKAKARTTESMAAAAHRPWTTGPDVHCPHCDERFPDQAAVDASKPPETKTEIRNFQLRHAGMRFGTPPLFKFPITAYVICILHLLLRLMAITFLRTVAVNINTVAKADAVNALIKALHLGCKKLEPRKKSGDKKKDTQNLNFIGREARVLLHPDVYNTFLNIVIDDDEKRANARTIWDNLACFYNELIKPLDDPTDQAERLRKSVLVQDKAVAYVDSFTAQVGMDKATLYMHQAMDHIPEMVLRFEVDISDMSQQFVEAKLKEGKTDMQLFSNKRLVDETQKKGRNQQVMAKGRERIALKQSIDFPLSRNEKRQLGDGSKAAEQTVERARRRGQLASRSQAQIEKRVAKCAPDVSRVYLGYKNKLEQLTGLEEGGESDEELPNNVASRASASFISNANTSGNQGPVSGMPRASGVAESEVGRGAGVEPERGGLAAGPALAQAAGRGAGRGGRAGGGGARGRGPGGAGRGAGARGRGRGRTTGGRAIPASARPN